MKKKLMLLVFLLAPLGSPLPAQASYMSYEQRVNFTYAASSYWAFIWDYTRGARESATTGFVASDFSLGYGLNWNEVHVAYIYNDYAGRYTEALALRDVLF